MLRDKLEKIISKTSKEDLKREFSNYYKYSVEAPFYPYPIPKDDEVFWEDIRRRHDQILNVILDYIDSDINRFIGEVINKYKDFVIKHYAVKAGWV